MPTTTATTTATESPRWCTIQHTWDGPEFHASVLSIIEARTIDGAIDDDQLVVRLFQPVESDTVCVVAGGHALLPRGARGLADVLRMFADMAEGGAGSVG